ncbi:hypothetical protein [Ereboglobus luteus]|uniref:Uncharacterized protein n=1 Tax=Ereboglobus luteus TaxID=1796921 RepID=A0A2U8E671_9BACT|nr:hypothetical protein [Ereboglobus luteus]AWI10054.1 hypothetical protein CKA38_13020 [Ereboglobus luteus]
MNTKSILSIIAALSALFIAGCGSTPKPVAHEIKITVDKSLENTSLQIDIIGANAVSDLPKWQSYSITDYWQPGNATRRDTDRITLDYGRGKPSAQTVAATDAKWKRWLDQGASNVVIIADLPGIAADRGGAADPRRLILSLDAKAWKKDKKAPLEILVQESGLRILTPPATEKKGFKLF